MLSRACFMVLMIAAPATVHGQEVSIETAPPVVIRTTPESGSTHVDADLSEIKVTFSKQMTDKSWSWAMISKETFPSPLDGKPARYEQDQKTAVLPVRLERGKNYAIWLNTSKLKNFKDSKGLPAVPYLLIFQTRQ